LRFCFCDFSVLRSLTPERPAAILNDVKRGECPAEYLELAQDIELKDLHYRSVLSTRKDAVTGLEIKIIPADDGKRGTELADFIERDIVKNPKAKLRVLTRGMLDALAKGFSANEIVWDTGGAQWKPAACKYRDPRWFQYGRETGTRLMLRAPYGNDIADSDVTRIVDTVNAALAVPYIDLNFGKQDEYPKIDLFKPDEKNIEQIILAVEKLGAQGLTVKADELRSLIGLSNPEEGDEVIGGRAAPAPMDADTPEPEGEANRENTALNVPAVARIHRKAAKREQACYAKCGHFSIKPISGI
jgi:phage gp29-like protein